MLGMSPPRGRDRTTLDRKQERQQFTECLLLARSLTEIRRDPEAFERLVVAVAAAQPGGQKTAAGGGTNSPTAIQEDFRDASTVASTPA
jgi:hypothetical protein